MRDTSRIRSWMTWMPGARRKFWPITREIVRAITENFQNGSQYVKLLDNFQDINMMIAYLGRYLHISGERKYEYLKTDSIKERSLLFMTIC